MKNYKEFNQIWARIKVKAWEDKDFKAKLLANPDEVLHAHGIGSAGKHFKIHENTKTVNHLTLPLPPEGMSESELKEASGGGFSCGVFDCSC